MKIFVAAVSALLLSTPALANVVRYELTATRGDVNLSGKATVDWALMINGSIPAPTLEFTEGDDAEIIVRNNLDEEVSVHWHGILLPPEMDGVAYVNTPPIMAGETHTFRFKIRQHGTYWYHSHTMLQEQKGIYGAIIIHPKEKKIAYDKDVVVVLSDWSDENPDQIIRNLRKDGDYYLYKKDSIRSLFGALQAGALGNTLHNEWTRMGGMDLSDVGYDAFLINGKRELQLSDAKPGERLRIRIVNAAASSYFYVSLGEEMMNVIAADGVDIEPRPAKEILMGMAETYDILYQVPEGKSVELRATVQDVTGYASGWIGLGTKVPAPTKPKPDMYAAMDHSAHAGMDHGAMSGAGGGSMDHVAMGHASLTVDGLKSPVSTAFPRESPTYDVKLVLGGDMERYVWHINGRAIYQDRTIEIKEGDVVRFTFQNDTMMHHPMHLHGHFFRVLTAQGDFSPLKHTVDVPPHGTRTIEFMANEPGEWMLHCHNLYHMKSGMARVVKYSSYTPKPEIAKHQAHDPHLHDHLYYDGKVELATNHAQAAFRLSKTWDTLEAHVEARDMESAKEAKNSVEGELLYRRWMSNYLNLIAGATYAAELDGDKARAVVGVGYMLPMLIESDLLIDHEGKLRLEVGRRLQWTKTVFTDLDVLFRQQEKTEFEATVMYGGSWHWSAGLMVTEDSVGGGVIYKY